MNLNNLIKYCHDFGLPDPLSGIDVPSPINKNLVRSAIMVRCGLLTPLYGEPDVFTQIVADWFKEKEWTFKHLINIINAEYSPIENVDEYTDYTDKKKNSGDSATTENRTANTNTTNSRNFTDNTVNSGTDTTTNTISAENASTYQPDTQTEFLNGKTVDLDHKEAGTNNQNGTENIERKNINAGTEDLTHTGHRHGNIGVTSNQQLIEAELNLLKHFDIYRYIAELFEAEHMLMIY